MADTLASQFLTYRREQDSQQVEVLRQSLAGRITQLQASIADLDKQIAAAGTADARSPTAPRAPTASRLLESRQALVHRARHPPGADLHGGAAGHDRGRGQQGRRAGVAAVRP